MAVRIAKVKSRAEERRERKKGGVDKAACFSFQYNCSTLHSLNNGSVRAKENSE